MAIIAVFTMGAALPMVMGLLSMLGYKLTTVTGVSISILVGFSADYPLHLAKAYTDSDAATPRERVADAMNHIATAIISAATSTFSASIFLFFTTTLLFQRFGVFMV